MHQNLQIGPKGYRADTGINGSVMAFNDHIEKQLQQLELDTPQMC